MKLRLIGALAAATVLLSGCNVEAGDNVSVPGGLISNGGGAIPYESNAQIISQPTEESGDDMTIELCLDPDNRRQLRISDGVVIITGSMGDIGINDIYAAAGEVDLQRGGNTFTCTISDAPKKKGYLNIVMENEYGQPSTVRLRFANGKFMFPNVLDIAKENISIASGNVSKDSRAVTLKNITKSGTADGADEVLERIRTISNDVCGGIDGDYDKLRAISRWVSENIYYDHDAFSEGIPDSCLSLEYMLENRRSVCGGYANMTAALAQAQGIICYSIAGEAMPDLVTYAEASKGEVHEWNYAIIDGRGMWVDSGWNSYNHYRRGKYSSGEIGTMYFDVGNEFFALDHKVLRISDRNFFGALG